MNNPKNNIDARYNSDSDSKYGYGYDYTDHQPATPSNQTNDINVLVWLARFAKVWYLFVITVVGALCFGYLANRSWQPLYNTEGKIIIESSANSGSYNFMQGFSAGHDYINSNNQLLILGSYDLINRTVKKLPFGIDFYTRGRFRTLNMYGREPIVINLNHLAPEAYGCEFRFIPVSDTDFEIHLEDEYSREIYPNFIIKGSYGVPFENFLFFGSIDKLYLPATRHDFLFRFRSVASLEDEFFNRLRLEYIGEESSVVSVNLAGNIAARDQDFINALSNEFLERNLEEKNQEATRTIEFINEQLAYIADSLHSSELRLRQYRRQNNLIDINDYTSNILNKLSSLDRHNSELNLKEAYFNELASYLTESIHKDKLVAPSSIGVSDPVLLDLVGQYNEMIQKRSEIGESNPAYTRLTERMEETRGTMLEVMDNVRKINAMERRAFQREYDEVMAELQNLPEKELAMVNYERSYKINDNYYTFLLQKQSEAQIRKASNVPDNKILQQARTNPYPINATEKTKKYVIGLIIGLIIPMLYVILRELLNFNIRSEADINHITQYPILGIIRHTNGTNKIQSTQNAKSLFSEGFRLIRSRIEFATQRKSKITIMVTSAESGDGKTHFAANLAGIYSMVSPKVILLDLEMRNPKMSKQLGYENTQGIVHAIIGENTLDQVIIKGDNDLGFDFLPVGVVPPNPAELMGSDKMFDIINHLKEEYDYIILDTSPLGLVSDAYALASMSDINIMVTRAFKTNKSYFKNFIQQIAKDQLKNVYIVLNDVMMPKQRKYGRYSYIGKYNYGAEARYYHSQSQKYYTSEDEQTQKRSLFGKKKQ